MASEDWSDGADSLERFVRAQQGIYSHALRELRAGRKQSHWMWFVFPQLRGLGRSPTALFYGIASLREAKDYLAHPSLGPRLNECMAAVNATQGRSAVDIFGPVDAVKLRSSATLFHLAGGGPAFELCLQTYFGGRLDDATVAFLNAAG